MEPTNPKTPISAVCNICLKTKSKYTCPRCNAQYCSTECYRAEKHQRCSEAFYRDCFMEGLKDMKHTKQGREKIVDMLKTVQQETQDSDDGLDDLHERLTGLDLNNTDSESIWNRLTANERRDFEAMLQDGRVGNVVEIWQPWWLENLPLVEDVTENVGTELDTSGVYSSKQTAYPEVETNISSITTLLRGNSPSECIQYNVLNVLYGYAYMARLYNGDYIDTPLECTRCVLSTSKALQLSSFSSPESALNDCILMLQDKSNSAFVSTQFLIAVLEDVVKIIGGKDTAYVIAALSELWKLFRKAKRQLGASGVHSSKQDNEKRTCFGVQKKLEFYLAWCKVYGDILNSHIPCIQLEFCRISTDLVTHEDFKAKLEEQWGGSVPPKTPDKLIEEL